MHGREERRVWTGNALHSDPCARGFVCFKTGRLKNHANVIDKCSCYHTRRGFCEPLRVIKGQLADELYHLDIQLCGILCLNCNEIMFHFQLVTRSRLHRRPRLMIKRNNLLLYTANGLTFVHAKPTCRSKRTTNCRLTSEPLKSYMCNTEQVVMTG